MKRGRPVEGAKAVEALDGSEEAKRKLQAVLRAVSGEQEIEEICRELGIGKTAFYRLRARLLGAALQEGEPKAPGRPPKGMTAEQAEIERLRAQVRDMRLELEVAYVREEIMLGMPEVFEPLKKKRREQRQRQQQQSGEPAIIEWDGPQPAGGNRAGAAAPVGAGPDRGGDGKKV